MTLLGDVPPAFKARLSQKHVKIVEDGRRLRKRLPRYVKQQAAKLIAPLFSSLLCAPLCSLPADVQPLIAENAAPTHEDIWENRLPVMWVIKILSVRYAPGWNAKRARDANEWDED
jgi:hypothetical protein